MNDVPLQQARTVALDPAEWQSLVIHNVAKLHQYLTTLPTVGEEQLLAIDGHWDRTRALLRGWRHASGQVPAPAAAPVAASNGEDKPKGRGGWQKGRKRKPQTAQVAGGVQ